jgi:hypothetical protein
LGTWGLGEESGRQGEWARGRVVAACVHPKVYFKKLKQRNGEELKRGNGEKTGRLGDWETWRMRLGECDLERLKLRRIETKKN